MASPALTGTPTAPTATAGTNTTQLATTAYADAINTLRIAAEALKAPLASPALTGVPTAPTAAALNNTTQLATTAYADAAVSTLSGTVTTALALKAPLSSPALTGTPSAPTATLGTNTTQLATTAFVLANAPPGSALGDNVLINSDFRFNQGGYVSAATLAASAYGHDQWKAGASGGDYSFTQLKTSTQITIATGKSLIQPIEDVNVAGGSYVLSWTGTAQARVGINTLTPSGSYASSPITITGQTAGTAMSVEFNAGTLGVAKLELGTASTAFFMRPFDR